MTSNQTIETVYGNFQEAYNQCVKGTIQHVDQIMTQRRTNLELRNQFVYTADGMVYSLDDEIPTLRITREATNPILNNIEDAVLQFTTKGDYQVLPADFELIKSAPDTVTIDLTKLTLQEDYFDRRHLIVPSTNYEKLNREDRKLAERVYGQGTDFVENMQMLHDVGIKETLIYVLNPEYMREYVEKGTIGRVSWLFIFGFGSHFVAINTKIDHNDCMRGVRKQ